MEVEADPKKRAKLPLGWKSAVFIYGCTALENTGQFSIMLTTFSFLFTFMNYDSVAAANTFNNILGTAFLLALPAGYITDTLCSRFKVLAVSACLEVVGYVLLAVAAAVPSFHPPSCQPGSPTCVPASSKQKGFLLAGFYILAIGVGGMRPNLPTLGADQFDEDDPVEKRKLPTYFNWFYFAFCLGGFLGSTFVAYVLEEVAWAWGYGICGAAIGVGLLILIAGIKYYRAHKTKSSVLQRIAQVLVAAYKNRNLPAPESWELLYDKEAHHGVVAYTASLRCLDKAAVQDPSTIVNGRPVSPWKLCTLTQVEEAKCAIRVLPMFGATILQSCVLAQLQSFSMQEATSMNRKIGSFEFPAASIAFFAIIASLILLPLYDLLFVPVARRITGHERGITHLQRVGVGVLFVSACTAASALVEIKRIHVAKEHNLLDNPGATVPVSAFWMALPSICFGISEMFTTAGLLDFFYAESPESMHSMATSLLSVSLSLGFYLSSVVVTIVNKVTRHGSNSGWLPYRNINRSKLYNFYWLLSILGLINFFAYVGFAMWYKGRSYYEEIEEHKRKKSLPNSPRPVPSPRAVNPSNSPYA